MRKYTVVATTFNDEKEIRVYLDDLMAQTQLPFEIVIADGGSSDNTVNIIKEYGERFRTKVKISVLSGKRLNISQGYNAAMREVHTDLIGFTGIGNRYSSTFFETLVDAMRDDIGITYCPVRGQDNTKFQVLFRNTFLSGKSGQRTLIATNHGALLKKDVVQKMGFFYEKFIYAGEDAEYYSRADELGIKALCVPDAVALWDTPRDFSQYKRQVKNYTIAELQLSTTLEALKASFKLFAILGVSIFLGVLAGVPIISPVIFIALFWAYCSMVTHGLDRGLLLMSKYWLRLFYLVKFRKYLEPKYKVRGLIF